VERYSSETAAQEKWSSADRMLWAASPARSAMLAGIAAMCLTLKNHGPVNGFPTISTSKGLVSQKARTSASRSSACLRALSTFHRAESNSSITWQPELHSTTSFGLPRLPGKSLGYLTIPAGPSSAECNTVTEELFCTRTGSLLPGSLDTPNGGSRASCTLRVTIQRDRGRQGCRVGGRSRSP
jgi:hypothetical protein